MNRTTITIVWDKTSGNIAATTRYVKKGTQVMKCSDPDCLGWTINGLTGAICACDECKVFETDDDAAHALDTFVRSFPVEPAAGRCSPVCRGWDVTFDCPPSGTAEILVCVDCDLSDDDDTVYTRAVTWILAKRAGSCARG